MVGIIFACFAGLFAKETTWTPEMPYDTYRSGVDDSGGPWDDHPEAHDAEVTLRHLLEAHKQAVILGSGRPPHNGFDPKAYKRVRAISYSLHEVVSSSYLTILPFFKKKGNPNLLLMILYHFEVYCAGGDGDEAWPWIIEPLQRLDPVITAKAKEMAKKGKADLHKLAEKVGQTGASQPATSPESKVK
jgi:hypothetical protein